MTKVARGPRRRSAAKPIRVLLTVGAVAGLVAALALPNFAPGAQSSAEAQTIQQLAADNAQTLVAASEVVDSKLDRDSYSATTPEEIADKKAEEAAAAAAAARAAAASVASSSGGSSSYSAGTPSKPLPASANTGSVRWPLPGGYRIGDGFRSRGGYHEGVDMLIGGGTPIYAVADGVVNISSEGYYGFGVAVTIDSVVDGQRVNTVYAHMTYGSRQVYSGQHVSAGQIIGLVGSTGRSTANHLHFEVRVNGGLVDPYYWLTSHVG